MTGLILVEGLPGSGKSTAASGLAAWLNTTPWGPAAYWPEGRADHPADSAALTAAARVDGSHVLLPVDGPERQSLIRDFAAQHLA